mgnify:CR=1 FL=1
MQDAVEGFKEVDVHAPFQNIFDVSLVSPNPFVRELCIEEISLAAELTGKLGGRTVTFHTGWACCGMEDEEVEKNLKEGLTLLNEVAGKHNVRLCAEVADYFMPADKFTLLEELGLEHIGITLDTGHISFKDEAGVMYRAFGTIGGFIERFAALINHVHIHDFDGSRDHLPLGEGSIDFEDIVRCLMRVGYEGALSLELNPDAASRESILKSRDILVSLINGIQLEE